MVQRGVGEGEGSRWGDSQEARMHAMERHGIAMSERDGGEAALCTHERHS